MIRKILFIFILFVLNFEIRAQVQITAGGFPVKHFGVKTYGMHPRNFWCTQDAKGVLYFGNAYGVLEFDGINWRKIALPNGNSGLSIVDKNGQLFVGSYNEFGYLLADKKGSLEFKSLIPQIPQKNLLVGNINDVLTYEDAVLFYSFNGLYFYRNNQFSICKPSQKNGLFVFAKVLNHNLFVHELGTGLCKFNKNKLQLISKGELLKDLNINGLYNWLNKNILIVAEQGLYVFDNQNLKPLNPKSNSIFSNDIISQTLILDNQNIVVTTKLNGLYIIDNQGNILKHISIKNGLQSNTINHIYKDRSGTVWLSMDNGIAQLEINSPFTYLSFNNGVMGMGYSASVFQNKLYLGTSNGVYVSDWNGDINDKHFEPVQGLKGQVWQLFQYQNTLLCCQFDHVYQIVDNQAILIEGKNDSEGNWKFESLLKHPNLAIKGTFEGFQLYELQNGKWKFLHKINGFSESCRVFSQDQNGNIWMCHGNKGLYKITLSPDLKSVSKSQNINDLLKVAPDFFNDVSIVDGNIVFSAEDGVYQFDEHQNKIFKNLLIDQLLNRKGLYINKVIQTQDGDIWIFTGDELLLFQKTIGGQYLKIEQDFKKNIGSYVGSFEFLSLLNQESVCIGSQEGFIFYNTQLKKQSAEHFQVLLRKVEGNYENDTILWNGHHNELSAKHIWPYSLNSLRFNFASNFYENADKMLYQYALVHKNDSEIKWSAWSKSTSVNFDNLYEGEYVLHIRAKNLYNILSDESRFEFTILAPWYRTLYAWIFYSILLLIVIIMTIQLVKRRFQKQTEFLENQKQKELLLLEQKHIAEKLQNEKELIALKNEKLQAEVILKNNELAALATNVTQKSALLADLKEKLEEIKDSDLLLKELIKTIDKESDFDDNWSDFQKHFDELNNNFLHRLREKYPKLNPNWLLFCAYIRMNKSNKEIASLMNITVSAVEKRKYRLREKLNMDSEDKFSDFIFNL